MLETAISRLREHASRSPSKAFICEELSHSRAVVSYEQAWRQVQARAAVLPSRVEPGEVVLIFLPQGWTAVAAFLAVMARGAVPSFMPLPSIKQDPERYWSSHRELFARIRPAVVITDAAHSGDIGGILEDTSCELVVYGPTTPAWDGAPPELRSDIDAPALLQHSSGTTGLKKGVAISHRALALQALHYGAALKSTPQDVIVSWLPLYHDMGLIACLMLPLLHGQTIILLDPFQWVGRPVRLFEAIARHHGTHCWLPNFAFDHMVRLVRPDPATMSLRTMRTFINCSEVCRPDTFNRFLAAFKGLGVHPAMLQASYGMAETTFAATQTTFGQPAHTITVDGRLLRTTGEVRLDTGAERVRLASSGRPIGTVELALRMEDGQVCGDDTVGEIWLRADFLFAGYHNAPEVSATRLIDGWLRTRDRGFVHAGEVYVLGRLDDLLIINGRNMQAAEIEGLLASVAGLRPGRAVAFDIYNDVVGSNELVLVAETADDAASDGVREEMRRAVFEGVGLYPARILLVGAGWLQKTTSGKVSRHANKERYLASLQVASAAKLETVS